MASRISLDDLKSLRWWLRWPLSYGTLFVLAFVLGFDRWGVVCLVILHSMLRYVEGLAGGEIEYRESLGEK